MTQTATVSTRNNNTILTPVKKNIFSLFVPYVNNQRIERTRKLRGTVNSVLLQYILPLLMHWMMKLFWCVTCCFSPHSWSVSTSSYQLSYIVACLSVEFLAKDTELAVEVVSDRFDNEQGICRTGDGCSLILCVGKNHISREFRNMLYITSRSLHFRGSHVRL